MSTAISIDSFIPLLNEKFIIYTDSKVEDISAFLIEVTPLINSDEECRRQSWSLTFQFPPEPVVEQGLYEFEHAAIGRVSIFVVPISQNDSGICFQAIFN